MAISGGAIRRGTRGVSLVLALEGECEYQQENEGGQKKALKNKRHCSNFGKRSSIREMSTENYPRSQKVITTQAILLSRHHFCQF
jgi:hypothetical protein